MNCEAVPILMVSLGLVDWMGYRVAIAQHKIEIGHRFPGSGWGGNDWMIGTDEGGTSNPLVTPQSLPEASYGMGHGMSLLEGNDVLGSPALSSGQEGYTYVG